ncbi:MAG TPA: alpha/beta fold hydrolase [Vicinamibacteria bacterium]|nr:alpha/beta fold hydrolase [Vicinamibacteria bacterium]
MTLATAQEILPTARTATVNGATLAYDITGEGPPIVLISGGGTLDRRMWDEQVAALAPDYTVLRYDVRGIGGSSRPDAPFSHSEDLNTLLQSLELEAAYIVGLSFGAGIAIDLALDHPSRVRGLVLAAPGVSSDKEDNLRDALAVSELARKIGLPSLVDAIVTNRTVLAAANDTVRERVRAIYLDNGDAFESDFALVRLWRPADPPAEERLSSIRVPTLILVGDQDSEQTRATADMLAARIGDAKMIVLRDAGHLLNFDAPDRFNEAVLDFLLRSR